jgi:hypothetical protein
VSGAAIRDELQNGVTDPGTGYVTPGLINRLVSGPTGASPTGGRTVMKSACGAVLGRRDAHSVGVEHVYPQEEPAHTGHQRAHQARKPKAPRGASRLHRTGLSHGSGYRRRWCVLSAHGTPGARPRPAARGLSPRTSAHLRGCEARFRFICFDPRRRPNLQGSEILVA